MKGSRQFRATLSELDSMMKWVREALQQCSIDSRQAKQFALAVEEALVNVIYYAYDYPSGIVEVVYAKEQDKVFFSVKDKGVAFNPLENAKPVDRESPLEKRIEGGLGIHFILNMTDSTEYQRKEGWNILTLTQRLSKSVDDSHKSC